MKLHIMNLDTGDADANLIAMISNKRGPAYQYDIVSVTAMMFGKQSGYVVVIKDLE
jgi:hypothetical protein